MKGYTDAMIKATALDHAFHRQPASPLAGITGGWSTQQKNIYADTYRPARKAADKRESYTSVRTQSNHP